MKARLDTFGAHCALSLLIPLCACFQKSAMGWGFCVESTATNERAAATSVKRS